MLDDNPLFSNNLMVASLFTRALPRSLTMALIASVLLYVLTKENGRRQNRKRRTMDFLAYGVDMRLQVL